MLLTHCRHPNDRYQATFRISKSEDHSLAAVVG